MRRDGNGARDQGSIGNSSLVHKGRIKRRPGKAELRSAAGLQREVPPKGLEVPLGPGLVYLVPVTSLSDSRPLRRLAAFLVLGGAALSPDLAAAQGLPFAGFTALPSFAWPQAGEDGRWAGSYARMSTGF